MSSDEEEYDYDYSDDGDGDAHMDNSETGDWPEDTNGAGTAASMDDDNDDETAGDDRKVSAARMYKATPAAEAPKAPISMKSASEIQPDYDRECADVSQALGVSNSCAIALLRSHNWCRERLLERFFEKGDEILQTTGVYRRAGHVVPVVPEMQATCAICYEEDGRMIAMPCGHSFCADCWAGFIDNAVGQGPSCVLSTCPQADCKELVTEDELVAALGESSPLLQKFRFYQLRSFVESNPLYRWCPGPGCEKIAAALSQTALEASGSAVQCDACETQFCLICGEEPHAPADCTNLAAWNEKCRNESETANWVLANTKPCPKCHSRIEKNQGCNHMTCQSCRHEFCWICMGTWSEHGAASGGYYRCNRFDSKSDESMSQAKRDLDRYLHYYKRFHAHSEAQKFAARQLLDTETRMAKLQESAEYAKWSDVEFLKTANEQLVECRRVLKFTYVFGYYLHPTDDNKKQRETFEYHQELLERFTENLSELSEKPIGEMDRGAVVNQTRSVAGFIKSILKYVGDGMEDLVQF